MADVLMSFDIDGTLEFGDPQGPISVGLVRALIVAGVYVGSSSDRHLADQRLVWQTQGVDVYFCAHKHAMATLKKIYRCTSYVHIGDTLVDEREARRANMTFIWMDDATAVLREFLKSGSESCLVSPPPRKGPFSAEPM